MSGRRKQRGLVVNAYSERWLGQGFPWVYAKEVVSGGGSPGQWVEVRGASGQILGSGVADSGWIRVRVFRDGGPLEAGWVHERLQAAKALRDRLIGPDTTGFRLVNAECDRLPGVRIDWWSHFAVVILDSPSLGVLLPHLVSWLEAELKPRGIALCYRQDPRDDRSQDGVHPAPGLLSGRAPTGPVRVSERGVGFLVDPLSGPDVGLYADMRDVRAWLEPYWGGREVLNTFAYTGAFSVAAALNGASHVVSVDLSQQVLDRAVANFVTNDLDPEQHTFLAMDTFKALDRFRRKQEAFDVVVLDPPSFSRAEEGVWSSKRDYPRLVAAAARILRPGGWIVAASNHGATTPKAFRGYVLEGLKRADRPAQELYKGGQAADFPGATWFPEGRYLKVGVWCLP